MMRSRLREIRGCIPDLKDHFLKSNGGVKVCQEGAKKPLTDNFTEHLLVNKIIIMSSYGIDTAGLFILCLIVAQSGSHSRSVQPHGSNREPDLLCEAQRGQSAALVEMTFRCFWKLYTILYSGDTAVS